MFGFMKKNQEPSADLSTFGLLPGKKIKICSADFRDGQQSLYATRFQTREILPIIPQMDEAGYASMEMWGGATFDVCMRYLNDDPWERLRQIKAGLTGLSGNAGGQNDNIRTCRIRIAAGIDRDRGIEGDALTDIESFAKGL